MELVRLRNNTSATQSIVHLGQQISIEPKGEGDFAKVVADKFLANRAPLVSIVEDMGNNYVEDNVDIRWVANVTGDPDAPEKVAAKEYRNGRWHDIEIPNPIKNPRTVARNYDLGQQAYTAKDGAIEMLNLGQKKLSIPAYKRTPLPKNEATWFVYRDAVAAGRGKPMSVYSRAPSDFEPDMTWTLDDMRSYLKLTDADAVLGDSEETIERTVKKGRFKKYGQEAIDSAIDDAKRACLKRVFFRLVNPAFSLPTPREFSEFMGDKSSNVEPGIVNVDVLLEEVAKKASKVKRGRKKTSE